MLTEVLNAIYAQHTQDLAMLSCYTGLSEPQVVEALRQLDRLGYIADERPASCGGGCAGCRMSCGDRLPRIITLTEKGRQIVSNKK